MVQWVVESVPHGGPMSRFRQCSMTDIAEAVVCAILSVGCCM